MISRRIISFVLATTLSLSLLVPFHAAARSCGEAARVIDNVAKPAQKSHGCAGCKATKKSKATLVTVARKVIIIAANATHDRPPAAICCNDGREVRSTSVDVPTLASMSMSMKLNPPSVVGAAFIPHTVSCPPTLRTHKIGASPPHLASVHQHSYLYTAAFLI